MKKRILLLGLVLLLASVHIFAKTEKFTDEYGNVIICSTTKLTEKDFLGSDFFIPNIKSPYHKDLNAQIFNLIKSKDLKEVGCGDSQAGLRAEDYMEYYMKKKKGGEVIEFLPEFGYIYYSVYDKKSKSFVSYELLLQVDIGEYKARSDNIAHYNKCIEWIDWCNWTLENCSNPTIRKSRTVSVPYTYQERVLVEAGSIGSRTGSYGSSGMTQDRYETVTRTAYRDEIEYYDAPNPNYNPDNVTKAKKELPSWKAEKADMDDKIRNRPLTILVLSFDEWVDWDTEIGSQKNHAEEMDWLFW